MIWSWLLTAVGVACFFLAGRKVWWAWYVGLAGQALWLAYSVITQQWGFLVGVALYTWVYTTNARRWTKEHFSCKANTERAIRRDFAAGGPVAPGRMIFTDDDYIVPARKEWP